MNLEDVITQVVRQRPNAIAGHIKLLVRQHCQETGEVIPSEDDLCGALGRMSYFRQLTFSIDKHHIRHYRVNDRHTVQAA